MFRQAFNMVGLAMLAFLRYSEPISELVYDPSLYSITLNGWLVRHEEETVESNTPETEILRPLRHGRPATLGSTAAAQVRFDRVMQGMPSGSGSV
jgi:hypothetical protein